MEKIVIGVCDDQPAVVEELKGHIYGYVEQKKIEIDMRFYFSGKDALEDLEQLHILFLDIEMPQMDGIETGKVFFEKNKQCKIIMATACEARYREAFKINALRFVTKPFLKTEIEEALESAFQTFIGFECVQLYENRRVYDIQQRDIKYVRSYDGYIEAVVGDRTMRRDISLSKMEEILDQRLFYRISREYIANLYFVSNYQKGTIYIGDGKLKISRRKVKEFEMAFRKFDIEYRG